MTIQSKTHLDFLDAIRGGAVLAVFLFHALGLSFSMHHLPWAGWFRDFHVDPAYPPLLPLSFGWAGVAVFFVISGFCIHLSWVWSRDRAAIPFYLRRFFRIYPPYLLILILLAGYDTWRQFKGLGSLAQIGSHALLVQNFRDGTFYGVNPAFWSIAVEFQLYLLYPLVILAARLWGWNGALCFTGVIEISLRLMASEWNLGHPAEITRIVSGSPFFFWFSWTIGAALADAMVHQRPLPFAKAPVWLFPSLFLAACFFRPLDPFAFTFAALATVNLIARRLKKRESPHRSVTISRAYLSSVGKVSYSLYLIHLPLLTAALHLAQRASSTRFIPLANFGLCLLAWPLAVMLSNWMYRFVELPSVELGKRLLARLRDPVRLAPLQSQ